MIMVLVVNFFSLLFSAILVRPGESMLPLKSFKISESITYDCIDIYKQPGLDHPLLKNHTIQMKPSVSFFGKQPSVSRHETNINTTYTKEIGCPYGTVPILRNTKEYISNAESFSEKNVHLLTRDTPGTHIVGVRSSPGPYHGIDAWFSGYQLNIGKDQASYSQMYIGSFLKNQVNFIQAGFMINPSIFGDQQLRSYGFWKGKNRKGCYNTACPGFVQVSRNVPISRSFDLKPGVPELLRLSINQDRANGNWWLTQETSPQEHIGYWPKELFNLFNNGANIVGVGGVVHASPSGSSPPMGNGNFPKGNGKSVSDRKHSALISNIEVLDSNYILSRMDSFPIEKLMDSPNCYGFRLGSVRWGFITFLGYFFNYGGPGGNSCGV